MHADDVAPWLRLTLTPGLGNASARRLLAAFGSPQAVFTATEAALAQVVSARQARAISRAPEGFDDTLARTLQWLREGDAAPGALPRAMVAMGEADYPQDLLHMEDPPLVLYALGRAGLASLSAARGLAMVGSRNPTPQGAQNARQFAQALSEAGLTVVSGLALGIDGAAHEGALLAGRVPGGDVQVCRTVAVVGTGLDRVYPARHRELARRIAEQGLILSEYPLGTPPLPANFPKRNRLICGLASATLVVEAALESGSLITARLASEQGKDVMAIPGSIHSPQSRGCHALIKQGAKLVESAADVLEEMSGPWAQPHATNTEANCVDAARAASGFDQADPWLDALGHDPVGFDALQARTGLDAAQLQAKLLEAELMGLVARLPGGLFQRLAST